MKKLVDIRGVARNLIWVGINCTISILSWVKETKQPHKKFKVGIYPDIPPSLRPWSIFDALLFSLFISLLLRSFMMNQVECIEF